MPVAAEGESLTFFDRVPFSSELSALFSYGMQNGALNELQQHSSCTLCKQFLPKKINRFDDCMVIPLTSRIDEKFFLLSIYSEIDAFFSGTKLDQIEAFGNLINIALQKEQYFQEILRHREQLETLSHKLVNLQEEERRNIALELHDEIGQLLTVLKIILELSPEDTMEEVSPKVDEAREIIDTLLNRVRELSWSLRPAILDDLGLMPALVWLFARLEKQTGLETSFYNLDLQEDRYPAVLEITMFRIIQESLTNVERHANTKQVAVRLWQQKGTLNVQIADKGKGFIFNKGIHLLSIRERVKLMEGQLQVDTEPGEGCRITVMLPIPDVEDSDGN